MLGFWIVLAALVGALLWVLRTGRNRLEWVVKPAASLTFVAAGWAAGLLDGDWTRALFAGLVLAAVGDVLLIPKDRRVFLAGIGAFLLGHVAYVWAFLERGVHVGTAVSAGVLLALLALPIVGWLIPHVEPPMRWPVRAYVVVITAMVAVAAGTVHAGGNPWLLVGAVGFYLSDLTVARDRFVAPGFLNRAVGLPLYFASQLLLATTAG